MTYQIKANHHPPHLDDSATVRIAVKGKEGPKVTDVVNICDQQSMDQGLMVRRRTIITLGQMPPSVTPTTSGINVTLKSAPADQQEMPLMFRAGDSDVRSSKMLSVARCADAQPVAPKMSDAINKVQVI